MDEPRVFVSGIWRRTAKSVLSCVAITAVSLGVVSGVTKVHELRLPSVDLSSGRETAQRFSSSARRGEELHFAVATMVGAEATFSAYQRLVRTIARRVGRKEVFVLCPSYADVRRALEQGRLDVALVCTGTYAYAYREGRIRLLVEPEFEQGLDYRCLIIVPAGSTAQKPDDLRGKVMAFTDPESNTGFLVPSQMLAKRGWRSASFFGRIVFTGSHDRSIQAVARAIVDAAAVDSLVWESVKGRDPLLTERVRVIWASEAFGPPPVVVPRDLDESVQDALRAAFVSLHESEEGRQLLSEIGIVRFVPARQDDYVTAVELYERFRAQDDARWP
jgi:phosphonate transport system substrate-binding protein